MPSEIIIPDAYRDLMKSLGLDRAENVFSDPHLRVWRDLPDRDNSTLDATRLDGTPIRLHVKRDKVKRREPMSLEANGITLLNRASIDSAPLVAHGSLGDRTFVVTENLDGYTSADRLIESGTPRAAILHSMADLAAKLHNAGLHHRDLYANHFYLKPGGNGGHAVRLIDTARVRRLPGWLRERWIVKDVAQLVFSVESLLNADETKAILDEYLGQTSRETDRWFQHRVAKKVRSIARHDLALREKSPTRNVRLPDGN